MLHPCHVGGREDDREFFTAETRRQVGRTTAARTDRGRDVLQDFIAG
jgi:hypothetical protein